MEFASYDERVVKSETLFHKMAAYRKWNAHWKLKLYLISVKIISHRYYSFLSYYFLFVPIEKYIVMSLWSIKFTQFTTSNKQGNR